MLHWLSGIHLNGSTLTNLGYIDGLDVTGDGQTSSLLLNQGTISSVATDEGSPTLNAGIAGSMTFKNDTTGVLTTAHLTFLVSSAATIVNAGTFQYLGGTFNPFPPSPLPFTNTSTGTVQVDVGDLQLSYANSSILAGTYTIAPGANLAVSGTFTGGNWSVTSGTMTVGGTVPMTGNYTCSGAGTVSITGLKVGSGGVTFDFIDTPLQLTGFIALNGNTLTNDGLLTLTTIATSSGQSQISDTVPGGSSSYPIPSAIVNNGTIVQQGPDDLIFWAGDIDNEPSGNYVFADDIGIEGLNNLFLNSGVVTKNGTTGTSNLFIDYHNIGGTVEVQRNTQHRAADNHQPRHALRLRRLCCGDLQCRRWSIIATRGRRIRRHSFRKRRERIWARYRGGVQRFSIRRSGWHDI